jgi:hypothetical protein
VDSEKHLILRGDAVVPFLVGALLDQHVSKSKISKGPIPSQGLVVKDREE